MPNVVSERGRSVDCHAEIPDDLPSFRRHSRAMVECVMLIEETRECIVPNPAAHFGADPKDRCG